MTKKHYTPEEMRANSMNPNNSAYWDSVDNRSNQLNPNNEKFKEDKEEE